MVNLGAGKVGAEHHYVYIKAGGGPGGRSVSQSGTQEEKKKRKMVPG